MGARRSSPLLLPSMPQSLSNRAEINAASTSAASWVGAARGREARARESEGVSEQSRDVTSKG